MYVPVVDLAVFLLIVTGVTQKDSLTDGGVAPFDNTDETLSQGVDVKYFNKLNKNLGLTWIDGGQTITFNGSNLNIENTSTFISDIETIFMAHGFTANAEGPHGCETFVKNYNTNGRDVQVVCIDWRELAAETNAYIYVYTAAAENSIDVGWWLGKMLHELVKKTGLDPNKIQLIGHSLGAHLVGMMGRTFTSLSGSKVGRITGLDPAGPRFIETLQDYKITKDSGAFVDIIHTNGDFDPILRSSSQQNVANLQKDDNRPHYGDLHVLGHADFYPNGGETQKDSGCPDWEKPWTSSCSHGRAVVYYLQSILDGPSAFPAYPCASAEKCSEKEKTSETVVNHMGEHATPPQGELQEQYYLTIDTDYGPV